MAERDPLGGPSGRRDDGILLRLAVLASNGPARRGREVCSINVRLRQRADREILDSLATLLFLRVQVRLDT